MPLFSVSSSVKSYDWGVVGKASLVAVLAKNVPGFVPQDVPYAELWIGSHPSAPSQLTAADGAQKPLESIPFLLKVLSIHKPLSIQAHPDKLLAQQLHAANPANYPDPNHKPEMAIALTKFNALLGFRPPQEIAAHLSEFPELAAIAGASATNAFLTASKSDNPAEIKAALKSLLHAILSANIQQISNNSSALISRLSAIQSPSKTQSLVLHLNAFFPNDIGIFSALLLNYVSLNPGQAIYLGPNEPHAYISGNCVECMATSDNVVRAGLTPKFKDVNTLVSMLTYNYGSADAQILLGDPVPNAPNTRIYDPPIDEFTVTMTHLSAKNNSASEPAHSVNGPSIFLVTEGSGSISTNNASETINVSPGSIVYLPKGQSATINRSSDSQDLVVFRAFNESK